MLGFTRSSKPTAAALQKPCSIYNLKVSLVDEIKVHLNFISVSILRHCSDRLGYYTDSLLLIPLTTLCCLSSLASSPFELVFFVCTLTILLAFANKHTLLL